MQPALAGSSLSVTWTVKAGLSALFDSQRLVASVQLRQSSACLHDGGSARRDASAVNVAEEVIRVGSDPEKCLHKPVHRLADADGDPFVARPVLQPSALSLD
jgi:hypothetical protein